MSEVVFDVRGLDTSEPATDIEPGRATTMQNLTVRDGGIQQRPVLRSYPSIGSNVPMVSQVLGGAEIVSVTGVPRQVVSGTTNWAWFSDGSWSALSYVTAGGVSDPPSLSTVQYWDIVQIYDPNSDEMIAVGAPGSHQSLYCWKSGSTLFSTLSTAPRAKYVAPYDNYLMALNIRDPVSANSIYVQRVQWSDRGDPSNWTAGLSGFEDLLDMRGAGTRIIADGRRIVIFSDLEIWQGVTANAPFQFLFSAIDRGVGCPYPNTISQTPLGIMFLGNGNRIYLLPKDGGGAREIGQRVLVLLRDTHQIANAERAWSVYDSYTNTWRLYYRVNGSGPDYPVYAVWFHLDSGEWTSQRYNSYSVGGATSIPLTRGWAARVTTSSNGTEWDDSGFSGTWTWATVPFTWSQLAAATTYGPSTMFAGASTGSVYKEWSDVDYSIEDSTLTLISRWQGAVVAQSVADNLKEVTEVGVDFATPISIGTMVIGVGSNANPTQSYQEISTRGTAVENPRQLTAFVRATLRYPMVTLQSGNGGQTFPGKVRRLSVRFRVGGIRRD